MEEKVAIAKALGIYEELDLRAIRDEYEAFAERIRPMVCDTAAAAQPGHPRRQDACSSRARRAPCSISTTGPIRS